MYDGKIWLTTHTRSYSIHYTAEKLVVQRRTAIFSIDRSIFGLFSSHYSSFIGLISSVVILFNITMMRHKVKGDLTTIRKIYVWHDIP